MVDLAKLENLAFRLVDLPSLRKLAVEGLQFEFADKPVNKQNWTDAEKEIVVESKIIAEKNDFFIYYIQTNTDSLKHWKGIAGKIIKEKNGFCLVCSHNPSGFKWVFSSLSKEFSRSFSETRHVPIEIRPSIRPPGNFVEFLGRLKVGGDSTATSIASQVSEAFDTFAVEIHNELTFNVFEALKTLSEGIIGDKSNKLSLSDETLREIRPHIFTLLYRIIFILYAEDRGIFPVDNKIYHEKFSLKWIKEEWLLKSTNIKSAEYEVQKRLKNLFKLIELGSVAFPYPKEEFSMRSYYGRLFDNEINSKLESWKISNSHLIKTLEFLTRTRDRRGNYFFLDYAALETRHLGAVYEHLLEFHLHVKNKKIEELPDPQERKASGSYYTPKYIVDYIAENSIEPLIDKIINENSDKQTQIVKILELKILDPAMGSGHFLVGAVEYVAKRLCEIEFGEITEQNYVERKRDVVRRCIYGVDMNPLAVDLASLSLWLETLSSEKPLSFLRSHLKCGNSLIGSEIGSIFAKQATLFESSKGRSSFKKNIRNFLMFENLEDNTSSAVKIKLEEYSKMQSKGTIYKDLEFLLNCKTAESFGVKNPILFRDYSTKIGENSLDYYSDRDFQKIDTLAKKETFFHWELEFPQIFYDENGNKKTNPGFDCVIANPPYVDSETMTKSSIDLRNYCNERYDSASGNWDLFCIFVEKGLKLCNENGYYCNIMPNKLLSANYADGICNIIRNYSITKISDYSSVHVFDVDVYPIIIAISKQAPKSSSNITIEIMKSVNNLPIISEQRTFKLSKLYDLENVLWASILENEESIELSNYIYSKSIKLGNVDELTIKGAASVNEAYEIKKIVQELKPNDKNFKKFINTGTIDPYTSLWEAKLTTYIKNRYSKPIVQNDKLKKLFPKRFAESNLPKIIIAGMTKGIEAFYDENKEYLAGKSTTIIHSEKYNLKNIAALLNSKIVKFLAQKHKGISLAGGYLRIGPPLIKELSIPSNLLIENKSQDVLSKLVDKLQSVKNNPSFHDKNSKIIEIENKIENIIFDAFELNEEQKSIILNEINDV